MEEKQSINKNIPEEDLVESTSGGTEETERERFARIIWEPRVFRKKRLRSWKPQGTPRSTFPKKKWNVHLVAETNQGEDSCEKSRKETGRCREHFIEEKHSIKAMIKKDSLLGLGQHSK